MTTNALRIRTQIESDTLRIPELSAFVGKRVEVIVLEEEPSAPPVAAKRPLGTLRGMFAVPDDFDAPLPEEVLQAFEGQSNG